MNSSSELRIQDYIGMVRRRKWLIVSSVTVSLAIAVALCFLLPKSFRSTTTVLVESQKIPESYVKSGVEGSIEGRLSAIQQLVMSRSLLTQIAEDFKLFRPEMSSEQRETVIEGMRKKINVTKSKVGHAKGPDTIEGFSISFAHEDPVTAMKVTERFASQFIEENLKIREQMLEGASTFLEQELHMAEAKLEDQERSISDFKKKYMGELPQQTEANLRSLDRLQMDVNATREGIQGAINKVAILEKQVSEAVSSANTQVAGATTSTNQGRGGDPLIVRLGELERTLATLSAEYRETYPDIIQTRQEIESIKSQLAVKYGVTKDEVKPGSAKLLDPVLRDLMRQRDEAKNEVEALKERLRRLLEQVKQYEGRVERAPAREQELMILVRDYDNMQKNYQSLLEKRLNARLAENLEKRQKGEQFRILDPANLPATPESPNRPLILLGGLVVGCGLGFGGVFALEMLRPAFRRSDEAETMLGVSVLASIPDFSSVFGGRENVRQVTDRTAGGRRLLAGALAAGDLGQVVGKVGDVQYPSWNLVAKWSPRSMVAEQFRVAATRFTLMTSDQKSTVAVITSAVVGEGKTSTAVNLSYILAQELDKKTLLIDCDLKRPMVHAYTDAPTSPGLVDYLLGDEVLDACMHQMEDLPLWILPAGSSTKNMLELSKIKQLSQVLHVLRSRFDYIIIDAPPIFPLADVNVLSSMADRMILVIRAGRTGREVVGDAYKTLGARCPANIVLTGVDAVSTPYYMYQYGNYGTGTTKHA
ncbi:XrtA system polysaccharide chain length determinant [Nitrospira sp. NS4]|uniref:XrtA system polysaccharide chain length determinant n=1 Tax=Nitrospira sp. NS4 TaxID=3414498 RepID=UPI003C2C83E4